MLNGNSADCYVGSAVYQAHFSSENDYHWHSPISVIIKEIKLVAQLKYLIFSIALFSFIPQYVFSQKACALNTTKIGIRNSSNEIINIPSATTIIFDRKNQTIAIETSNKDLSELNGKYEYLKVVHITNTLDWMGELHKKDDNILFGSVYFFYHGYGNADLISISLAGKFYIIPISSSSCAN
jgi:hypothetical protein